MNNEVQKSQKELLVEIDKFEDEMRLLNLLNKRYDDLKKEIKNAMVKLGRDNGLEQVKWITPNGTKITCTIGHCAEIEKQKSTELNVEKLKKEYPHIYEECCEEKEVSVITKNASNDTLRITLKEKEGMI